VHSVTAESELVRSINIDADSVFALPTEARDLLTVMLHYETARFAKRQGTDRSRRKVDRVGLISSFLAVCSERQNECAMTDLCRRVLRTDRPSRELLGTFLAALELSPKDVPGVRPRIRMAMLSVLQTCVDMMSHDGDPPPRI
jgi:hypothetical protein